MTLYKFLGLTLVAGTTLVLTRLLIDDKLEVRWSDIPIVIAIMFGVSPYGQICYRWIRNKFK